MRLYLSSFRVGNRPDMLLDLLDARKFTAVITNADDYKDTDYRASSTREELQRVADVGLEPTELDLREFFGASAEETRDALQRFDLLWVRGGSAFVLRRAFRQSGADRALKELLVEDSVVYGGYSAGTVLLGPSLRGFEFMDDPRVIPNGYDPPIVWDCLRILPYTVVPHYRSIHPSSRAADQCVEYFIDNHIVFKALRDGEAIVVDGRAETVVG